MTKTPTNRQVLTSVGNKKIGYERREQKIILKCDTFQKKYTHAEIRKEDQSRV